jgi:hypothetical protein
LLFQIAGIIIFFDMTYQQEHMSDMSWERREGGGGNIHRSIASSGYVWQLSCLR